MDNRQTSHQMIDRALAIAGVAIPIIGAFLPEVSSKIPKKIKWISLWLGVFLLVVAAVIFFLPDGEAQQPPAVNQGPGSAYSYGQQGGITAGTLNIAPSRWAFSDQLGNQLLADMPMKKPVFMTSVGGIADQKVATDIQNFLQNNGYQYIGLLWGFWFPPRIDQFRLSIIQTVTC